MDKLKNKIVLVVDDEARNMFALSSYLQARDMKVEAAVNGEEAIAMLLNNIKPDVILLDMMMPVMDGYETLAVLKDNEALKHIPVIAVTAKAMKGDREKCLEAGAWDYVSKPINMQALMDKLNRWIV